MAKKKTRLNRFSDLTWNDIEEWVGGKIVSRGKTKAQLIGLIHDLAQRYPEMAMDLSDRQQLISGNTKTLVTRLREEIRDIGNEPGWQNYWKGEGYTPDYSGIRKKLETLLQAGNADGLLTLGRELVKTGTRQVEESHDEGETAMEIAPCMPVIVEALDRSSLEAADKLNWALDAVLDDQFEVCEAFAEYLHSKHPKTAWHALADRFEDNELALTTYAEALDGDPEVEVFDGVVVPMSTLLAVELGGHDQRPQPSGFDFWRVKPQRANGVFAFRQGDGHVLASGQIEVLRAYFRTP